MIDSEPSAGSHIRSRTHSLTSLQTVEYIIAEHAWN